MYNNNNNNNNNNVRHYPGPQVAVRNHSVGRETVCVC